MQRPIINLALPQLSPAARLAVAALVLVALIAFARAVDSSAFLWVGLAGVPFLLGYARLETRAFLIIGSVLVGSGIGILFEANLNWEGAYLTSVGASLAVSEALEPRPGRLVLMIGAILAGLGVALGIAAAGTTTTVIAVVLVLAGGAAAYLRRRPLRPRGAGGVR